jgi:hypothetical protein
MIRQEREPAVSKRQYRGSCGWRAAAIATAAAFLTGSPAAGEEGQASGDVFASSGRSCGYPGRSYDMSRVVAAAQGYPNGRIYILTPQEKSKLEQQLAQWNRSGGRPMREMAPCFDCSPRYEACIVFERGGDVFASNGGGPPGPGAEVFGSNSGGPPPAKGSSDACRKNPQSYTCLFGHPDVLAAKPKTQPPPDSDCLDAPGAKTSASGREAAASPYDPAKINGLWKQNWMPKWGRAMSGVNLRVKSSVAALVRGLAQTPGADANFAAAWSYELVVGRDGTITAKLLLDRDKGALVPQDWLQKQKYMERAHSFLTDLQMTKAPAFPAGSRWVTITRWVQFQTVDTTTLPDTEAPKEPYASAAGVLLPGAEAKGTILPPEGLKATAGKLCD